MKSAIADYRYIIYCLKIVPVSGSTVYLTNYPRDLVINGHTYRTDSGYDFTGIDATSTFSASSFDLSGIVNVAGIDRDAIASGVFDNARCYCFATTWVNPTEDEEEIGVSIFGKTKLIDGRYNVQMMCLIDVLNQSVVETYEPLCQKKFGGQEFGGCGIDLADYTETGTLTAVIDNYTVVDSARAEEAGYFVYGTLEITSGDNAGLKIQEIKSFESGTITLYEPFYYELQVGDTYEIIAGCDQTEESCKEKSNINRFGGFSFVPQKTTYIRGGVNQ